LIELFGLLLSYFQIGLSTALYRCTVYTNLCGERLFINQCRLFAFNFSCVPLASMCFSQVSRISWGTSRYVTSVVCDIWMLFRDGEGQVCLLKGKVRCLLFCSLNFMRQSPSHLSKGPRWADKCSWSNRALRST